ncbi:MAG: ECF-type sigma factor [Planctomycetota bacterium]
MADEMSSDRQGSDAEPDVEAVVDKVREIASRLMRRERGDHTLQTTALVNEAFLKLHGDRKTQWRPTVQFYSAAAEAMRRVLVDHARSRLAEKRGGQTDDGGRRVSRRVSLDVAELASGDDPAAVLDVEEAIESLANVDADAAQVVRLRVYAGMSVAEVATALATSERTVAREWSFAKAWLYERLSNDDNPRR